MYKEKRMTEFPETGGNLLWAVGVGQWAGQLLQKPENERVGRWELRAPIIPLASSHSPPAKWSLAGHSLGA